MRKTTEKRFLTGLAMVLLLSCLSFITISCSPSEEKPGDGGAHVCNYVAGEVIAPSCTTKGYTRYNCSCGRFKDDDFTDIVDHEVEKFPAQSNICQIGWSEYEACKNCSYTTKVSKPAKHSWLQVSAQQANCYQKGWNAHSYCDDCGYAPNKKEFDYKHGELVDVPAKSATCEEEGYKAHKVCLTCNQPVGKIVLEAKEHNIQTNNVYRAPTCTEAGHGSYEYCTRCTYSTLAQNTISPLGHSLQNHSRKKPSCTESGYEAYQTCSRNGCNWTTYQRIPATGHTFKNSVGVKKECSVCQVKENTIVLYENGKTDYKIFCNRNNEMTKDLRDYLNAQMEKTVGWSFGSATLPSAFDENAKVICIGKNSYSQLAGVTYDNVWDTDYQVSTKGNSIFLLGSDYSLRFGIYELLNIFIGYEKYSIYAPGIGEEIYFEKQDKIELGQSEIERTVVRDIEYNIAFNQGNIYNGAYGASSNGNASMGFSFAADIKNAGSSDNDDGVTESLKYSIRGGHNSLGFYPLKRYQSTHPEWYAKNNDGSYRDNPSQLCYYELNKDQEAFDIFMIIAKKYSAYKKITISNMDTGGECSCQHCQGNLAYHYFTFLNSVSDFLKTDPQTAHLEVGGMIYHQNSLQPPIDASGNPTVVLKDDVNITFAFDYADYYAGFSDIDIALLEKWNKVCPNFTFWTYCMKPNYTMFFFDDFTNKQLTYERLAKYGAVAVEDEGVKGSPSYTNFNSLRVWLCSKLAENTGLNMSDSDAAAYYEQITSDFFNQYFGPASVSMRQLFEKQKERQQYMYNNWTTGLYEQAYAHLPDKQSAIKPLNESGNNIMGTYSSWSFHYLGPNSMHGNRYAVSLVYSKQDFKTMLSYIDNAISAVNADKSLSEQRKADLIGRVELEKVGVLYQYLFTYCDEFSTFNKSYTSSLDASDLAAIGVETEAQAAQSFVTLCDKFQISGVSYTTLDKLCDAWEKNENIGWHIIRG